MIKGAEFEMYCLSKSDYASEFVLKGAVLFLHWEGSLPRPTKDVDFTREQEIEVEDFEEIVKELCKMDIDEEDGMIYLPDTVKGKRIREGEQYEGIRVKLKGKLGNQQLTVQLDLGFGDALVPAPEEIAYPVMLDFPAPSLKAYQKETTISEKFQNMVDMGLANSRMKDYYDIWFLCKNFEFEGVRLRDAISETFDGEKRRSPRTFHWPLRMKLTGMKRHVRDGLRFWTISA